MNIDNMASEAVKALQEGDPERARELLEKVVEEGGDRPDVLHALGVVQLQLGAPGLARPVVKDAISKVSTATDQASKDMYIDFSLTLASIEEEEEQLEEAISIYEKIFKRAPGHPGARTGLASLFFGLGELNRGIDQLDFYVSEDKDDPEAIQMAKDIIKALLIWRSSGSSPLPFIEAHRDSYCAFFDHHAQKMEEKGWIAEAAHMKRAEDGSIVNAIPEGAKPYAAVRVDLVDPSTGQAGMVGEKPLIVSVEGYEPLSRIVIAMPWAGTKYDLAISTQCPWDQLPIQVLMGRPEGLDALDATIGEWYTAGFNGAFGSKHGGRFHYISDPDLRRKSGVVYYVDMGRSGINSIRDLMSRLEELNKKEPVRRVIIGRGFLPV